MEVLRTEKPTRVITVRLPSSLHRRIRETAGGRIQSMNQWVLDAVHGALEHEQPRNSKVDQPKTLETWAIVELMGHKQFAGFVTEQTIGGTAFVRVDVPAVAPAGEELPAFTKLLGAASIYAVTPCTEETARAFAANYRARAFANYEAPRLPAIDEDA